MQKMYFIGVTTGQSSMMKLFPKWADILRLDARLAGYDIAIGAPAVEYQKIVDHIKTDPGAAGALVTTHKIDLLQAARDRFDELDPYAELTGEVSCISKRDGRLRGHAKDPITSGVALRHFVTDGHWRRTGGQVLCLGAGGAGAAISVYLAGQADHPTRFIAVDLDAGRLAKLRGIHEQLDTPVEFDYIKNGDLAENDRLLANLPPGSMVINATGMGKDRPGSPLTDAAVFPQDGLVWELNYRGERQFMQQAADQAESRNLHVEDGWVYFLHGWSQVVAEIFDINLTPEVFRQLDAASSGIRG